MIKMSHNAKEPLAKDILPGYLEFCEMRVFCVV